MHIGSERAAARARAAIAHAASAGYEFADVEAKGPAYCRFCREMASRPHSPEDCDFMLQIAVRRASTYAARKRRERDAGPKLSDAEWAAIIAKQRRRCFDCKDEADLTKGHLVPLVDGGTNDSTNVIAQCRRCNSAQGLRIHPEAYRRGLPTPTRQRFLYEGGGVYKPRVGRWKPKTDTPT
jgi:5-methylcytosine-specific restriction endonuclease McrA